MLPKNELGKLAEYSNDIICTIDEEGRFVWMNRAVEMILGYDPSELIGRSFIDYVYSEDREKTKKITKKLLNGENVQNFVTRYLHKDGSVVPIEWSANWDPSESLLYCIARDNTDLFKTKENYRNLFHQSPLPQYVYDLQTLQFVDMNHAALKLYKYSKKDLSKLTLMDLRPEEEKERLKKAIRKYNGKSENEVIKFGVFTQMDKEGNRLKIDITGQKIELNGKECAMVIGMNVTDEYRKLNEKQAISEISTIFNYGNELNKTIRKINKYLVDKGEFELGEVWLQGRENDHVKLINSYPTALESVTKDDVNEIIQEFQSCVGLPGTTWNQKRTITWDESQLEKHFLRLKAAKKAGIKTVIGVPLCHKKKMYGVLLFGSSKRVSELDDIIHLFRRLENILGSEVHRKSLEDDFNRIFETVPDIVCKVDFDTSIKRINKAGSELIGYSEEELKKIKFLDLVYEPDKKLVLNRITNSEGLKESFDCEFRFRKKTGEVIWLSWSFRLYDENGVHYAVAKDITKQKEQQFLINSATNLARIGGWELDLKTKKVYWSPMTKKIHGVSPDFEVDLETALDFYRDDVREEMERIVRNAGETGDPWDFEMPIVRADDEMCWVKSIGQVIYNDGEPEKIIGSFQDIHQRKTAELRLQNTADNIPGIILQYLMQPNRDEEIRYITKGSDDLWGYSPEECIENPDLIRQQMIRGGDYQKVRKSLVESIRTLQPWQCQFRIRKINGTLLWLEGFGKPSRMSDGSVLIDCIIIDISEKKELEDLVDRSSKMARIGHWELDLRKDKNQMYWSEMTRKILEVDESYNSTLTRCLEFYEEKSREKFEKAVDELIQSGEKFDLELEVTTYKGNRRWIRCIGEAEFSNDKCLKIYGSYQDIHERRMAQNEFEELYNERNRILESISDAFFAVDREWTVTYWNREAEAVLGTKSSDIVGKNLWEVYEDAVDLDFYQQYHKAMKTGEVVGFEEYYPTLDKWFDVTAYPSENGLSVYFRDVSIKKAAEEQERRLNERFEKVAETTSDVIYDWDLENDTLFLGEGFRELFGYNVDDLPNHLETWEMYLHPEDKEDIVASRMNAVSDEGPTNWHIVYRYIKADGETAFVVDKGEIIRDDQGKATRMVGAISDITERKTYEESLRRLNEDLQKQAKDLSFSNAELEQFAYVASHDLQEPLRMITSFLKQLEKNYKEELDDKANKYIEYAVDGAKRMRQIILDLLDFSRVGKNMDYQEEIDLNGLIDEICMLYRRRIDDKSAQIIRKKLPVIYSHRTALFQIFQNLISNSIKYAREGVPPRIQIAAEEHKEVYQFTISDNGIGIEKEYFEKVFILFQRLHGRDEYSGSGMGLAIVKKWVENLGGQIWLRSKKGEGCTFTFTIAKRKE